MTDHRLDELARMLLSRPAAPRTMVALAGPPGAGKSTRAAALNDRLNAERPGVARVVPMDGFHLDDGLLEQRGLRARKGAPETYDLAGFAHLLTRLRTDDGEDIYIPVFDRAIELSRAAGDAVPRSCRIVLLEGNYLLLDRPGWRELHPLFDVTVFIGTDERTLEHRLTRRWQGFGLAPDRIAAKVADNDLLNARLVLAHSVKADVELTG